MSYALPRPTLYAIKAKRGTSGLGLFAEAPIPRGVFVIEYWGKVVTEAKANEIAGKYLFALDNGKTIDGSTRKNIARYINHSCKPNCETEVIGDRVFAQSIKKIAAGEELTYDYGREYFDAYIKPFGCRCRACAKKKITG